jgi:hypothetical protein
MPKTDESEKCACALVDPAGPILPCEKCHVAGRHGVMDPCEHYVRPDSLPPPAVVRAQREAEASANRRVTIEAAYEWHAARREVEKQERDPRVAVDRARELAASRADTDAVREKIAAIAALEATKVDALAGLGANAAALARTVPTREEWLAFYEREIVAASTWRGPIEWCSCGTPFVANGRRLHCSPTCGSRIREQRSREKQHGPGRSWTEHRASCEACGGGRAPCGVGKALLDAAMDGISGTYTKETLGSQGDAAEWALRGEDQVD